MMNLIGYLWILWLHTEYSTDLLFAVFYPGVDFDFQLTVCLCNYVQLDTGQ